MNQIVLFGRVVTDIEVKYAENENQTPYTSFRLAVQRPGKRDVTDFINCKMFGKSCNILAQYIEKGDQLGVSGYLTINEWTKDGVTKRTPEVIVSEFEFGQRKALKNEQRQTQKVEPKPEPKPEPEQEEMDLPFEF